MSIQSLPDAPVRLVANLPYNVSVPVLLHFLEHFPSIQSGVVMVQAEVGHRLAAVPGSKIYGSPSVKAAWYGEWRTSGNVSRQVFWPVPNVDSVLVSFVRHGTLPDTEEVRVRTFEVVDAAFQQRRKMLRQSLIPVFGDTQRAQDVLERAGVEPTMRGEALTTADFHRIGRASSER
jgi:16S rRNA (adenine1518-N6/adenine1519-N6)-dimethyltransferase